MDRPGLLPLKVAVLALIAITVALVVITNFTDIFSGFGQQSQNQLDAAERQSIRNQCMAQKIQLCQNMEAGTDQWADSASYDGKSCRAWHNDNNIFGENSGIPTC